jgi:hypothetical protein
MLPCVVGLVTCTVVATGTPEHSPKFNAGIVVAAAIVVVIVVWGAPTDQKSQFV